MDHGVPCMSADFLAQMAKRCVRKRMKVAQMQTTLEAAHPILMQNIRVSSDGKLSAKDPDQIWIRRGGWEPGKILDPPHTI